MAPTNIITTGHDASGNSIFIAGHEPKVFSPYVNVIYSSDGSPLNLNSNSDIAAFAARDFSSKLFPTEGSVVVTAEWPPLSDGRADKMHRTLSVDIGVMLCGEIECHLDSGESRVVKVGDVIVQRGTVHAWVNKSETETAKMLCFVLPSQAVEGVKGPKPVDKE